MSDDRVALRRREHWSVALESRIGPRRLGATADVAGAVLVLAAEASSHVTGERWFIDGGWAAT